jgi:hypothetical protein
MTHEYKPQVGDQVECLFRGQWMPGEVLKNAFSKKQLKGNIIWQPGSELQIHLETEQLISGCDIEGIRLVGTSD